MSARPLLLGHRGARAIRSIPENTFASFDRALADGCDGFEFDVQLTGDREALICHDPKWQRIEIAKAKAEKLSALPTLRSVLERYRESAFLDIELKVVGLEEFTLNVLGEFPPANGYVVSSFLPEVLHDLRKKDPEVPLGLICDRRAQLAKWREMPVQYVIPHCRLVTTKFVEEVHAAEKKLLVWTVNTEREIRRFDSMNVDGIISDYPALLSRVLRHDTPVGAREKSFL